MHCLLVSHDATTVALVSRALATADHSLEAVSDYDAAARRLGRVGVDCVLTEWLLPGVDGMELIRRNGNAFPAVPVIMISELAQPEARAHALRAGAEGYVLKPVLAPSILWAIQGIRKASSSSEGEGAREIVRRRVMRHPVWNGFDGLVTAWLSELTGIPLEPALEPMVRRETGVGLSLGMFDPVTRAEIHYVIRFSQASGALLAASMVGPRANAEGDVLTHVLGELCGGLLERARMLLRPAGFDFVLTGAGAKRPGTLPRDAIATRGVLLEGGGASVAVGLGLRTSRASFVGASALEENMVVIEDIRTPRGALLVPAGTRLTSVMAAKLRAHLENREIAVASESA